MSNYAIITPSYRTQRTYTMGYTHYFPQQKNFTPVQWHNLCTDANKVIQALQAAGLQLESNSDSGQMVNESEGYISLNGVDDDAHETLYLSQDKEEDFSFTKTARKPYDTAVVSILLLAEHHAPGVLEFTSDGSAEDMEQGASWNAEVFGYAYQLPEDFRNNEPKGNEHVAKVCAEILVRKEKELLEEKTPQSISGGKQKSIEGRKI